MMIKRITLAMMFSLLFSAACKEEDAIVDCFGESLLVVLEHEADATTAHKVKFEIEYAGHNTLESVTWTFGDGKSETVSGHEVEHTYAAAGSYSVTADVTLKKDKGTCKVSPKKTVTVD